MGVEGVFETEEPTFGKAVPVGLWEESSLTPLKERLQYFTQERQQMLQRLWQYRPVFGETKGLTTWVVHDIDVGDAAKVKLLHYGINPVRQKALEGMQ